VVVPVVTPLVIEGAKKAAPWLEKKYIPLAAPFVGALIAALGEVSGIFAVPATLAPLLGLAGVGLREVVVQWQKALAS
jgi:hypothetical protein